MASNRYQYTLQFNADTQAAKKSMQDLANSFEKLFKAQSQGGFMDESINKAVESAKQLEIHLQKATDVNTGKLNLTEFNKSIQQAGTSFKELSQSLISGGAAGQQAFLSMASAIAQSEVPLKQMNNTLKTFAQTMKNTVKWEISSNIVHGLESAMGNAVSYAKNLNTSLTNIRIVTGQTVEDMAKFTVEANKAAKSLSTTTKAYADASLIYYQQGDSQEQAAKKAAITIKAANSSFNTSAAEMSEYLTAVWNSYQVGADELERYVDIMAVLGAKTATSLEEIATSMQKVAATANTVGVSMEQVSSIIATVSSVTRESAESIGTSYKTIFARIGDLKLGETLDDGVTLGQVSSQLDKIGVSILDANGDMRDMGAIIEDLGSKWQTMSRAEQTAIAQVVAGKRQYTQLMALFENWDMYQESMSIAMNADGALQEMADIYAESWEAASARVTASLENIYNKILNDQAIIKFTNGISGVIDVVGGLIDALGGMSGTIGLLGSIGVKVFEKQIAGAIDKTKNKITTYFGQFKSAGDAIKKIGSGEAKNVEQLKYQKAAEKQQNDFKELQKQFPGDDSNATTVKYASELLGYKEQLLSVEQALTEAEKQAASTAIAGLSQQQADIVALKREKEELLKTTKAQREEDIRAAAQAKKVIPGQRTTLSQKKKENDNKLEQGFAEGKSAGSLAKLSQPIKTVEELYNKSQELSKKSTILESFIRSIQTGNKDFEGLKQKVKQVLGHPIQAKSLDDLEKDLIKIQERTDAAAEDLYDLVEISFSGVGDDDVRAAVQEGVRNAAERGRSDASIEYELYFKESSLDKARKTLKDLLNPRSEVYSKLATNLTKAGEAVGALTSGLGVGENLVSAMVDESSTLVDKLGAAGGALTSLISGFATGGWIGLAASFVGILISGISTAIQKAEEERKKLVEENKAKAQEINDANSAELSSTKNLLNTYNELYARYQAGEDVQAELKTSALALADAYGLTSASVAAMTGNFELFNKEVAKTLNFANQMSDAKTALGNAGQAVTGSKNIGKVSVDMADYLGIYTDMDNANANVAAMIQEDALLSQATALKTTDDVTWDFIDEIYRQQEQMEKWSLESEHMLDAFIEFANQEASNYKEAFNAALEQYGLEDTKITATTARDKILDTLKDANVNVGDFLQAFYSHALLKGSEELNLADMGYSLAEIKSEDLRDLIMYGANSAAFQISSMENLDMEAFKNIAFSQSGLKNLQEANSSNNFSLNKIWSNFTDLYDSETGEFRWDDNLNAEDTVALYDRYVAWKDYLQKMLDNIVDTNSTEYQIISQFLTGVEKITDSEELSGAVSTYKEAQKNLVQWQLIQNSIQGSIGKSEEDISFTDYIKFQKDLAQSVDAQYTTFDSLKGFSQEDVTNLTDEYIKAREKVVAQLISEFTAFDDYATMYSALSMSFDDDQMGAISQLIDAENLAASDITYNFIEALKTYFASIGDGVIPPVENLQSNTLIQSAIKMSQATTAYNTNKAGRDKAVASESSFKQDMTQAEAEAFYSNYWGNEKMQQFLEDRDKPLKSWTEFVAMDYDAQQAYIEGISAEYATATQESAQAIIDAHADYIEKLEGLLTEDAKKLYGDGGQVAQNNYAAWKAFESLYTETDGKYMDTQGNTFDTKEAAFQHYLELEGVQLGDSDNLNLETWESFANIMAQVNAENTQYANAQASINAGSLVGKTVIDEFGNSITVLSDELSTLENEFNALNSIDVSTIPQVGTQAYEALSASLKKAGKTMSDYRQMSEKDRIKAVSQAKKESLEAQRAKQKEIENKYATQYGFNTSTTQAYILATGDKDKIAAYEAWIASQEAQANLTDEIAQEVQNTADELIRVGAANTDAAIARFEQEQTKLQSAAEQLMNVADILTSHITDGELNFAEQAQLDPKVLEQWNSLSTSAERAKFAAEQSAAAYKKQMEYQQNINEGITGAQTFANGIAVGDMLLSNNDLYGTSEQFASWLDTKELSNSVKQALVEADKTVRSTLGDGATAKQWGDAMRAELATMGTDGAEAFALIEAQGKDALSNIFSDFSANLQEEAQNAVDAWANAFKQIADARKTLIEGGSLLDQIAGDPETLLTYLQSYRKTAGHENATAADLVQAITSGTIKAEDLAYGDSSVWTSNQMKKYGLDTVGLAGKEFGTFDFLQDKSAIARMLGFDGYYEADADQKAAIDKQVLDYYTGMIAASEGIDEEVARIKAQNAIANNEYEIISNARKDLADSINESATAQDTATKKTEAMAKADEAIETYNEAYEKEQQKQSDWTAVRDAAEAVKTGDATDIVSALEDKAPEIADRLGMSLEQLNKIDVDTATQNIKMASIQIGTLEGDLKDALDAAGVTGENQVAGLTTEEREKYIEAGTEAAANTAQASYDYSSSIGLKTLSANESYNFLEGLDSQFKALDAFELEPKIENLNSLRDALDLTNPSIAEYYNAIANAESAEEREAAIDDLTTALLTQGDALLTNSEGAKILLENYAKTYGITDEFGEVLTTQAINAMKTNKRFNELNKTWKKTGKQIKTNNKELKHMNKTYDDMTDLYKDVAKAAKKTGKSIGDITKDLEGMTDEEKKLIEQASEEYLDIFDSLQTDLGDTFATLPQNMQTSIENCDLDGLISNLITPMAFDTLLGNVDTASAQFQQAVANMTTDSDAAIRAMGEQLQVAAATNGQIDLGTILNGLGVDLSNPIEVLNALIDLFSQMAGIEFLTGAGAAIGPLSSALSKAQSVQGRYGGGGGGAKNANTKPSGGKGGGGGSKNKTKEDKLRAEDEIERYHEQNEVLDRVGEKLEMIDKLKDRTYGKNHLAQLDAETKALKEQLAAQADLYNEANKWRASDQKELISLGVGVQFDEDGNISNYEEVMQALIEKQNANIERYNNSDQDEGDKLRLDADKQWYEDAVQAIEDYEEALRTGNEALIEMEEIRNQISELELEKITYKLEIETELNENDLELLEYYTDKWEDDLDKQADRFVKVTDSITVYQDNLTNLSNALDELNEQHQNGTINEADYAEGMQDIRDQIMDNLENLEDAGDQLKEIYSDALELAREEIEKTTDAIQHSSDVMESYISIMGLMGKANDFEQLQAFYDAQYTYGIQQVGVLKSTYDTLIAARAEYDAKIEAGQKLSEVEQANYDTLQEQIRETEEEMLSAIETTLEAIQAGYQNAVQAMSKDLEEFMVGAGNSIAGLADQYAYFQEKQDRYVSTAKELFEVSKLNRDIENSLADATTDASKEALKALQEKINKQSELNELTEYDIQMNQLEYQLLLARIQLEEASSSKDTVRLTRDENGNYAYQYTADQDKVNEAMQQYEDVLQQINELSVERTGEIEQLMIDAMQNNLEKFNEIMTDETLSTEERNQKIADLNTQFSETMLYLQEQAGIAGENLTWNQEMIAEHFGVSLSDITASTAGNVNESVQAMIDRADEFAAKMNAVLTGDGEDSVSGVWAEYQNRLNQVSQASGLNYDTMTGKISDFTHANDLAAGKANEVLDVLEDTLAPLTALTAAWGVHANMIESMVEYYEALADAMNDAMRDSANTGGSPVGAGGTPASTGFEDKGYGPYEVTMPDGTKVTHNATGPWSALAMAGVPYADIARVNVVPKFYRGGLVDFTGLAQLDGTQTDPELVLNADDTRNMLETVRVVRQLDANTLSLLVSSLETSVNSMMAFMGSSYHAFGVSGMQTQTLDQNVQITAEFPNVTDHNEIEEAFNSLVNRAAQFAKQK